jgi:hypothetical protein
LLTSRQKIAIENPCARAMQTFDRRFWSMVFAHGRSLSSILTVNK